MPKTVPSNRFADVRRHYRVPDMALSIDGFVHRGLAGHLPAAGLHAVFSLLGPVALECAPVSFSFFWLPVKAGQAILCMIEISFFA